MTLISTLAAVAGLYAMGLKLFLYLGLAFYGMGFFLHRRLTLPARMLEESRKARVRRWLSILLGGPASTILIAFLVGLVSGESRPESQVLAIGLGVAAAIVLMYLSRAALLAAVTLGFVHGRRTQHRKTRLAEAS